MKIYDGREFDIPEEVVRFAQERHYRFLDDLNNSYKPTNGRKHLYLACFRPYFFSPNR